MVHCPKNNLHMKAKHFTEGADATVYVWIFCRTLQYTVCVRAPSHSWQAGFFKAENQIIFGTVCRQCESSLKISKYQLVSDKVSVSPDFRQLQNIQRSFQKKEQQLFNIIKAILSQVWLNFVCRECQMHKTSKEMKNLFQSY